MSEKRLVKILSIDGGGVRGIIPAYILNELEKILPNGKSLCDCFDIIAGTSIGGILALTYAGGNRANIVYDLIKRRAKDIFSRTLYQKIKTLNGLISPKYTIDGLLESLYDPSLQSSSSKTLGQLKTNVIIPSYCIEAKETFLFSKLYFADYFVSDICLATSAAPTYFPAHSMKPKFIFKGNLLENIFLKQFIDGGVSVNNPTVVGMLHANEIFGDDIELFVVSIGTGTFGGKYSAKVGTIGWAKQAISIMLSSENSMADFECGSYSEISDKLKEKFRLQTSYNQKNIYDSKEYYRFQTVLEPENFDIDDVRDENLVYLSGAAKHICEKRKIDLARIAEVIGK